MRNLVVFILVAVIGTGILFLVRELYGHSTPRGGEYYYSETFRSGFNVLTACLFFLTGVATGLYTRLNPILTGLAMVIIFPIAAVYESVKYNGSHNLIPFEIVIWLVFAFPAIMGVYIGRLIYNRRVLAKK